MRSNCLSSPSSDCCGCSAVNINIAVIGQAFVIILPNIMYIQCMLSETYLVHSRADVCHRCDTHPSSCAASAPARVRFVFMLIIFLVIYSTILLEVDQQVTDTTV